MDTNPKPHFGAIIPPLMFAQQGPACPDPRHPSTVMQNVVAPCLFEHFFPLLDLPPTAISGSYSQRFHGELVLAVAKAVEATTKEKQPFKAEAIRGEPSMVMALAGSRRGPFTDPINASLRFLWLLGLVVPISAHGHRGAVLAFAPDVLWIRTGQPLPSKIEALDLLTQTEWAFFAELDSYGNLMFQRSEFPAPDLDSPRLGGRFRLLYDMGIVMGVSVPANSSYTRISNFNASGGEVPGTVIGFCLSQPGRELVHEYVYACSRQTQPFKA